MDRRDGDPAKKLPIFFSFLANKNGKYGLDFDSLSSIFIVSILRRTLMLKSDEFDWIKLVTT